MWVQGVVIYSKGSRVMGHYRKTTVRQIDGVTGEHIDPNIHNIDAHVGIVLTNDSVMRLML